MKLQSCLVWLICMLHWTNATSQAPDFVLLDDGQITSSSQGIDGGASNTYKFTPYYTDLAHIPVSWHTLRFDKKYFFEELVVRSTTGFTGFIFLAYSYDDNRELVLYKENAEIKIFRDVVSDSINNVYELEESFIAEIIRVHVGYDAPNKIVTVMFKATIALAYGLDRYDVLENRIVQENDVMIFQSPLLIYQLTVPNAINLKSFCVKYYSETEGIKGYSDYIESSNITIFTHWDVLLRPFVAKKLQLSCMEWNVTNPQSIVQVQVKGKDAKQAEHEWKPEGYNTLRNLRSSLQLSGYDFKFNRTTVNHVHSSPVIGDECYCEPDSCDEGFSVQFQISDVGNHLVDNQVLLVTSVYYFDDNKYVKAAAETFDFVLEQPTSSIGLVYEDVFFKGLVHIDKCLLQLPEIIESDVEDVEMNLYVLAFQSTEQMNTFLGKMTGSNYGIEINFIKSFMNAEFTWSTSVDIKDIIQDVLKQQSGIAKNLLIVIMPKVSADVTMTLKVTSRLKIQSRILTPRKIEQLYNVEIDSSSSEVTFEETMCLTSLQWKRTDSYSGLDDQLNFEIRHRLETCNQPSCNAWIGIDTVMKIWEDDKTKDITYLFLNERTHIKLDYLLCADTLRISHSTAVKGNITFYGSKLNELEFDTSDNIISCGLGGSGTHIHGTGFKIGWNNGFLNIIVKSKEKIYYIEYEGEKLISKLVTVSWKKGEELNLYGDDVSLVANNGEAVTSTTSTPVDNRKYLSLFTDMLKFHSYLKIQLKQITMFRYPLSEILLLSKELYSQNNEEIFLDFSHGPLCAEDQNMCGSANDELHELDIPALTDVLSDGRIVTYDTADNSYYFTLYLSWLKIKEIGVNVQFNSSVSEAMCNLQIDDFVSEFSCSFNVTNGYHFINITNSFLSAFPRSAVKSQTEISLMIKSLVSSAGVKILVQTVDTPSLAIQYFDSYAFQFLTVDSESFVDVGIVQISYQMKCVQFDVMFTSNGVHMLIVITDNDVFYKVYKKNYLLDQWNTVEIQVDNTTMFKIVAAAYNDEGHVLFKNFQFSYQNCVNSTAAASDPDSRTYEFISKICQDIGLSVPQVVVFDGETIAYNSFVGSLTSSSIEDFFLDYMPYQSKTNSFQIDSIESFNSFTIALWVYVSGSRDVLNLEIEDGSFHAKLLQNNGYSLEISYKTTWATFLISINEGWIHLIFTATSETLKAYVNKKFVGSEGVTNTGMLLKVINTSPHTVCMMLFEKALAEEHFPTLMICPDSYSTDICVTENSICGFCDQTTGAFVNNKSPMEKYYFHECARDFSYSSFESYYTLDSSKHLIDELQLNAKIAKVDGMNFTYGPVNQALCINVSSEVVLLPNFQICDNCVLSMWLKHHCLNDSEDVILSHKKFVLKCNPRYELPIKLTNRNTNQAYMLPAISGLWYQLTINFSSFSFLINAKEVLNFTIVYEKTNLMVDLMDLIVGSNSLCIDEVYVAPDDLDVVSIFNKHLHGAKSGSIAIKRDHTKLSLYGVLNNISATELQATLLASLDYYLVNMVFLDICHSIIKIELYVKQYQQSVIDFITGVFTKFSWTNNVAMEEIDFGDLLLHREDIPSRSYYKVPPETLCPQGEEVIVEDDCRSASVLLKQLGGYSSNRDFEIGPWDGVPYGCSLQSSSNDPHFNTMATSSNDRLFNGEFDLICAKVSPFTAIYDPQKAYYKVSPKTLCPQGEEVIIADDCRSASVLLKQLGGYSSNRDFVIGTWDGVPYGCSLQSSSNDPHFNTMATSSNNRLFNGEFDLICAKVDFNIGIGKETEQTDLFDGDYFTTVDVSVGDDAISIDLGKIYNVQKVVILASDGNAFADVDIYVDSCLCHKEKAFTNAMAEFICYPKLYGTEVLITSEFGGPVTINDIVIFGLELEFNDTFVNTYADIQTMPIHSFEVFKNYLSWNENFIVMNFVLELDVKVLTKDGDVVIEVQLVHNVDMINITSLEPYTNYTLCFRTRNVQSSFDVEFNCDNGTFLTLESVPSEAPKDLVCSAERSLLSCNITCNFTTINATKWFGKPHDFVAWYGSAENLTYGLTKYASERVDFDVNVADYTISFESDRRFRNICVVVYATTQNGTGVGVHTITCVRTCEGVPTVIPENIRIASDDESVTIIWDAPALDPDLWKTDRFDDIRFVAWIMNTNTENYPHMVSNGTTLIRHSNITVNITTENQYSLNLIRVAAFGAEIGKYSEIYCWLFKVPEPFVVPEILNITALNSSHVAITVQGFDPSLFRGKRNIHMNYSCEGQRNNHNQVYNGQQVNLEHLANLSLCNITEVESFFSFELIPFKVILRNLEPYTNCSIRVQFTNEAGFSAMSESMTVRTKEDYPDCAPRLSTRSNSSSIISVQWTPPKGKCINGELEGFNMTVSGGKFTLHISFSSDDVSHDVHVPQYGFYCIEMNLINVIGGGPVNVSCLFTDQEIPLVVPTLFNLETTNTTVLMTLTIPDEIQIRGVLIELTVVYHMVNNLTVQNYTFPVNHTVFFSNKSDVFEVDELIPFSNYIAEISYGTIKGHGNKTVFGFKTKTGVPILAANVTGYSDSVDRIALEIRNMSLESSRGVVLGYVIMVTELSPVKKAPVSIHKNYTSAGIYIISDCHRDGVYMISVGVKTSAGIGPFSQSLELETMSYFDGNWSLWSEWTLCSQTCGGGIRSRNRTCNNPAPTEGGYNCLKDSVDSQQCNTFPCTELVLSEPGEGNCEHVCGRYNLSCSRVYLTRNLNISRINLTGSQNTSTWNKKYHPSCEQGVCSGFYSVPMLVSCNENLPSTEQRLCNCMSKDDVGYITWASWGWCDKPCGVAYRNRYRNCYDSPCAGKMAQTEQCVYIICPVDGMWGHWSNYTECNKTCGYGYRSRTRLCNDPKPAGAGDYCFGFDIAVQGECNVHSCPRHGGVGDWSEWSECFPSCGNRSVVLRWRKCNNPTPLYDGRDCAEELYETKHCTDLKPCQPIDVSYNITFTNLKWFWKLHNLDYPEAQEMARYILNLTLERLSNFPIDNCKVTKLKKGSVISNILATYSYLDSYAIVDFIDSIYENGFLGHESVSAVNAHSPTIPCSPPVIKDIIAVDKHSVFISWDLPVCEDNSTKVIWMYIVYIEHHVMNAQWKVIGIPLTNSSYVFTDLQPNKLYRSYLLPAVDIGTGVPSETFFMESTKSPPEKEPPIVSTRSTTSRKVFVEWNAIPVQFSNGKILGYNVKYKKYFDSSFSVVEVPTPFMSYEIKGLKPFTLYWMEVCGVNAAGEGPPTSSMVKTLEDVPAIPVPNFFVRDMMSIEWWAVGWGEIEKAYTNGILLGYRVLYYLSALGDVPVNGEKQIVEHYFDNYTFYYKAKKMMHFAVYNVSVAGYTVAGTGPEIEYQARTCHCPQHLFAHYFYRKPFTILSQENQLLGFMPPIVNELVVRACGHCATYSQSTLHVYSTRTGLYNDKLNERSLKNEISSVVDVSFPIYGRSQLSSDSSSVPLVSSPGCAFIVRDDVSLDTILTKMILNVLNVWPLLLISYLIASLFGTAIWFTDQFMNPDEFTLGSSVKGPLLGFWFTFVTMTTVGYGDQSPRAISARILSMIWFLVGLVLNGIIIGFITTALTSLNVVEVATLYNTKTAALNDSWEFRFAVMRNANVSDARYSTVESMFDALHGNKVDVVLLDLLATAPYKELLLEKNLKVKSIIETQTSFGLVLSGMGKVLDAEMKNMVREMDSEITEFIETMKANLPSFSPQEANEATADIFSSKSPGFQLALKYLCICIGVCVTIGLIYEVIRFVKDRRFKISSDDGGYVGLQNLGCSVEKFGVEFTENIESMNSDHNRERVQLHFMKSAYKTKCAQHGQLEVDSRVFLSFNAIAQQVTKEN